MPSRGRRSATTYRRTPRPSRPASNRPRGTAGRWNCSRSAAGWSPCPTRESEPVTTSIIVSDRLPSPGQSPVCESCQHWLPVAWANGHPSPCRRVRWEGHRHREPKLIVDRGVVTCADFAAATDPMTEASRCPPPSSVLSGGPADSGQADGPGGLTPFPCDIVTRFP